MKKNDIAFLDAQREITYATFSNDITLTADLLRKEFPDGCEVLGISPKIGPYLHWVLHAACTILGIPTMGMRPNQVGWDDIVQAGPVDPSYPGPSYYFDNRVLAQARSASNADDKGSGYKAFVETVRSNGDAVNRIVLTSGSTGRPKAVPTTNAKIYANSESFERGVRCLATVGRDTGAGYSVPVAALLAGATVLMAMGSRDGRSPMLTAFIASTYCITVPTVLAELLSNLKEPLEGSDDRLIIVGGSRAEIELCARARRLLCTELRFAYGSTEAGLISYTTRFDEAKEPGNVGLLLPDIEVRFDAIDNEGDASNGPGLLYFRTPRMAPGYWDSGTITPFGDGWFCPGDMGYLNEAGELVVTGRIDDVVNYSGDKFSAVDLESQLKSVNGIEDAFIAIVTAGSRQLFGVVCVTQLDTPALKHEVATVLGGRTSMVFRIDTIPRNQMGKLERKQLNAWLQSVVDNSVDKSPSGVADA